MSWSIRLPARSVFQGGPDFCAMGSIATALSALGTTWPDSATSEVITAIERSVDTWTGPFNTGAGTGNPAGVAGALNRYAPPDMTSQPRHREFRVVTAETPYEACAQIVNALIVYRSPAVAMVYQGSHWVAVIGAFGEGTPRPGRSYTIDGLWICDPSFVMKVEQVTYPAWLYEYFTGFHDYPLNQFVVVVDSRAAAAGELLLPSPDTLPDGAPEVNIDVTACALKGLEEHDLLYAVKSRTSAQRAGVMNPVLRTTLKTGEGHWPYYLVAFEAPDDVTGGSSWTLVRVDKASGAYLGAVLGWQFGLQPYSFQTFVTSLSSVNLNARYSPEFLRRVEVLKQTPQDKLNQQLLWHPRTSGSPYAPLLEVDDGTNVVYVNKEGRGFTDLEAPEE